MRKILFIVIPIVAIFILVFVLLFTPTGSNSVIKPIANSYLAKKIEDPKIEIKKLDSTFGGIDIEAVANNGVKAKINGDINSYLNKEFNLHYNVKAQELKVKERTIPVNMDISGQATGVATNFGINGSGNAFDSEVNYRFIIKNNKPQAIEAHINSAKISQIFALANVLPFIDGFMYVDIKMPSLNLQNPTGMAKVTIQEGRFNQNLLYKKFGIKLPNDEKFSANFIAKVAQKHIIGKGVLNSTSAKLNTA